MDSLEQSLDTTETGDRVRRDGPDRAGRECRASNKRDDGKGRRICRMRRAGLADTGKARGAIVKEAAAKTARHKR